MVTRAGGLFSPIKEPLAPESAPRCHLASSARRAMAPAGIYPQKILLSLPWVPAAVREARRGGQHPKSAPPRIPLAGLWVLSACCSTVPPP